MTRISSLPLFFTCALFLGAQTPPTSWSVAVFTERENEDLFRTGMAEWEQELTPMRRTGVEIGWRPQGSAFRPSLAFASGHAPQGSHSHASLHLEWGTSGPFIVQGGFLLINQTHNERSNAGYGGRIQLGWRFFHRFDLLAYAGLTSLFHDQAPGSRDFGSRGSFAGFKATFHF